MPKNKKNKTKNKSACMCALFIICLVVSGCSGRGSRVTENPTVAPLPVNTVTAAPEYTVTPGISPTLQPTYTMGPTITVSLPTPTLFPSEGPTVSPEATKVPTAAPTVTEAPPKVPTATVSPTPVVTPGAVTVTISPTPEVSVAPEPTPEVTLSPVPTIKPEPTPEPEYDVLMNNGWQRTEDFYGSRDIYFSVMFEPEGAVTEPAMYGFLYGVPEDDSVSLSVIGEAGVTASEYREQLLKQYSECEIKEEKQEDYAYTYSRDGVTVYGRVYTTYNGGDIGRMRIELSYRRNPEEELEEGYLFYLKEK